MATRSKRQHTLGSVLDLLMAAQLCCGNKAGIQQLGDALASIVDPLTGTLLRPDLWDLAADLLGHLEDMGLYRPPEPF